MANPPKGRPQKLKVGDYVVCHWLDTVSYGRTARPDDQLILAEFLTYGVVSHINEVRIVVRTEEEVTPHPISEDTGEYRKVMEPVLIPIGCISKITVLKPTGEATVG